MRFQKKVKLRDVGAFGAKWVLLVVMFLCCAALCFCHLLADLVVHFDSDPKPKSPVIFP